jgi:hypothetical protein
MLSGGGGVLKNGSATVGPGRLFIDGMIIKSLTKPHLPSYYCPTGRKQGLSELPLRP